MSARTPADLRLGLVNAGDPTDPAQYSGAPAALLHALGEVAAEAFALGGRLPGPVAAAAARLLALRRVPPRELSGGRAALARRYQGALIGPGYERLRSRQVRAAARRHAPLDGLVHFGSETVPPPALPRVTYEDSTILQALRAWDWPHLRDLPPADLDHAVARQRRAYAAATACCAMSHWAARSIVEDYGQPQERVHVVGLGRNRDPVPAPARAWDAPRFLFVGFDWERKNGPRVLQAFAALRAQVPAAELDVVGGHPPIDQDGVTAHGRLRLGDPAETAQLEALYARATCFVLPSLHEPTGTVHAEAAAAGLPSIGTKAGGVETVIGDGGVLVDPLDEAAIAAAFAALADPETARAMGARAQERAGLFTWRLVAERLIRALALPGVDVSGLAEPL